MNSRHLLNLRPDAPGSGSTGSEVPNVGPPSPASSEINLASPHGAESAITESVPAPQGWNAEHGELGVSAHDFSYSPELSPEVAEDERQAWERLRGEQPEARKPEPQPEPEPPRLETPAPPVTAPQPTLAQPASPEWDRGAIGPRVGFVPLSGGAAEPPAPSALETAWPEPRRLPISLGWIIFLALLVGALAGYGAVKSRVLGEQMKTSLEDLEAEVSTKIAQVTERVVEVREQAESFEPTVIQDSTPSGGDVFGVYSSLQLAEGSVTSVEIADGTIKNADVALGAGIAYAKLNLLGQVLDRDLAGGVSDGKLSANVALLDRLSQTWTGTNLFRPSSNSTTAFRIQNAAATTNLFHVDSQNGYVGIGIVSPSTNPPGAQLSLGANAATDKLHVWEDTSCGAACGAQGFGTQNSEFQIYYPGVGANHISFGTYLNNTFTEKVRFDQGGNVGLGITNPSYKLEAKGSIRIESSDINTPPVVRLNANPTDSSTDLQIRNRYTAAFADNFFFDIQRASDSAALFTVARVSGNVGISGATNPQAALHLGSDAGTAASGIKLGSAGDTNLYRSGASALRTDSSFTAVSSITAGQFITGSNGLAAINLTATTGTPGLTIGGDTNLYRSGPDTLKTDDSFIIQTAQNAAGALKVQNQDGGVLLNADTANSQLTVTNLHSTGVISGSNGPASVQLKSQLASGSGLTMSGNEITDKSRSTNTSGDGKAASDSSTGIWEATTNLVANGGFESNTTGWTGFVATITRDTSVRKFGTASLKSVPTGSNNAAILSSGFAAISPGATFTASVWVHSPSGGPMRLRVDHRDAGGSIVASTTQLFTGTGNWQRVIATATLDPGATQASVLIDDRGTQGQTFYVDGVQIEQQPIATPYVETNGGTATRNDARAQAPAASLDETQLWIAARIRMGFAATDNPHGIPLRVFSWGCSATQNCINFEYDTGIDRWIVNRRGNAGGISNAARSPVQTFANGQIVTVVSRWTQTEEAVSVDGSTFTSAATATDTPIIADGLFDIGRHSGAVERWLDSDVLWFAAGTGTLTDADAATINRFGNGDPKLGSFPSTASPTMAWDGAGKDYEGTDSAAVAKSTLILDDTNLYRAGANLLATDSALRIGSNSTAAFQVQNAAGNVSLFQVDATNLTITLGSASATPVLLVLGNKNTAGDPATCTAGSVYYNSVSNQAKVCLSTNKWGSINGAFVTSLPASANDGDEVYYQADATNGIIWHLRYNAGSASAYKWEYLGGPALHAALDTDETTTSTTYTDLATVGPSLTLARTGEYYVTVGALTAGTRNHISYSVGGSVAGDPDRATANESGGPYTVSMTRKKSVAAGDVVRAKYRTDSPNTGRWQNRYLTIIPIRVGP